jgi:hypothetical protein
MFSGNNPSDTLRSLQGLATIPEFLWELFLGLYCTFKGFRPSSPILRADTREDRPGAAPAVAPAQETGELLLPTRTSRPTGTAAHYRFARHAIAM